MADAMDLDRPHMPLAKFRVLYIGRAAPKAALDSIEAIQKPLCELYTKDDRQSKDTDVDAVLTVLTSGLLMEPVNPLDKDLWLPIQNLQSCAAVKAVVRSLSVCGESAAELSFFPIDSPQAKDSLYPPIFSCVMGRSNGLPLNDCFVFICQSNEAALLTVQATMHAFGNKSGWANDRPSKKMLAEMNQCRQEKISISGDMDNMCDFYEKPPLKGFFYTPSPNLIQMYQIQGETCSYDTRSTYGETRTPYIPPLMPAIKPQCPDTVPINTPSVNPMIFYDTQQDITFVDEPARLQYPTSPTATLGELVHFSDMGASQAIAFNPYLVPSSDHPPAAVPFQTQKITAPVPKASVIPNKEHVIRPETRDPVIIPVVQEQVACAPIPHFEEFPIYQKRLPRSNIGVEQTYANHSSRQAGFGGIATSRITERPSADKLPAPFVAIEKPTEELYAQRLPPPTQESLPSGARQFDSNFILRQSDTDKARIADVKNHEGYPAPRQINIAEFGY